VFRAENGLLEYVQHLMTGKIEVSSAGLSPQENVPESNLMCEVALQYHDGYNEWC
jgi:DNA gyrase/topoisomerase IV subunit B